MNRFTGGTHTVKKIKALSSYLKAYSTALKNQGFSLIYIDAFAGSGSFSVGKAQTTALQSELFDEKGQVSLPGSARIALETEPPFDAFIFMEKDVKAAEQLRKIVDNEYPNISRKVVVYNADANATVRQICRNVRWNERKGNIRGFRAVMFLDPFALHVDWDTLVAIGETESIDIWMLVPVGKLNRVMARDITKIPEEEQERVGRVLGSNWWKSTFYQTEEANEDLFGENSASQKKTGTREKIEIEFIARLKAHYGYVHPRGLRLNARGMYYFSLIFAMASRQPAAHRLGREFATSIIDKPQGIIRRL